MGVDAPLESNDRATLFLIAHVGFVFLNLINICALLLLQGYVFGRLQKNYLSKLALAACTTQMMSCVCSIHRSNMNDEFGFFGHVSTALGLLAYCPLNIAVLYLLLNRNINAYFGGSTIGCKIKYLHIGIAFSLLAAIGCFLIGYINWTVNDFTYFRKFIGISTAFQVLAMIISLRNFYKRKIDLDPSILSRNTMIKVFVVCICLDLLALALAASGITVVQYPATGLTFTTWCIVMAFVGEMDFMQPQYTTVVAEAVVDCETRLIVSII
eukprot:CAMPEP_0168234238 /NCGR_PEP_ID=MMETSP0140_2-20121125/18151_1 /TAXON_ID=44445 /ORGANISM="Pseudo-nitzschia australis, Strain 10249 10 AB" /LENGTH=268 /DNA_ID=CAMNT_0008167001 /DNA_START=23 /DNA_END=829 /DNA_ORIENTATION=+